jgi:tRNA pseudouridine55 synthase
VASKGTYIRTLGDDIARELGGRSHLIALRRLRVGRFTADEAISLEELVRWQEHLRLPAEAVAELARWYLDTYEIEAVRHGRQLSIRGGAGPWAMLAGEDELVAVYRAEGTRALPEVVLA